jgi:hypothetical protein
MVSIAGHDYTRMIIDPALPETPASQSGSTRMASTPALPETPLDAVRTVGLFPSFTPPVASTLPASQQRQVTAARHSRASRGGFANAQNRGPSTGPSTSIPSRKGKHIAPPTVIKCAIIPFAVKVFQFPAMYCTYIKDIFRMGPTANP